MTDGPILSEREIAQCKELIERMRKGEPSLHFREINGKVLICRMDTIPKLSKQRLQARIDKGELLPYSRAHGIHVYTLKEK